VLQQSDTSSLSVFTTDDNIGTLSLTATANSLSYLSGAQTAVSAAVIPSGFYAGGVLFYALQGTGEVGSVGGVDRTTGLFSLGTPDRFTAVLPMDATARDVQASPDGSSYVYAVETPAHGVSIYGMETGIWDVFQTPQQALTINGTGTLSEIRFTPDGHYAYIADCQNGVWGLSRDSVSQSLTLLSPTPTVAGSEPCSLLVDPLERFLFVGNSADNSVQVFSIDTSSGALLNVGTASSGSQPRIGATDRKGLFLYVLNSLDNTISAYQIQSSGALAPIAGSPFPCGGVMPMNVAVHPNGQFLYVANMGSPSSSGNVAVFSIATDGSLSMTGQIVNLPGAIAVLTTP
jgi:6-phosphogluconolactonase